MLKGHLGTFENDTQAGNRNAHSSHLFIVWALTQNWSHRANTKKGEILQHWRSRLIGMKTLQSVNTEKNHMWIVCVCSVPERCGISTSSDAALPYDYMCQWGSNGGVRRHLISFIFLQIKVLVNALIQIFVYYLLVQSIIGILITLIGYGYFLQVTYLHVLCH